MAFVPRTHHRMLLLPSVVALVTTLFLMKAVDSLPSLPSYAQHPCPSGWTYHAYDDSCSRMWPKTNRSALHQSNLATLVNFNDATAFCAQFHAELPVIVDNVTQLGLYTSLVGNTSGVQWWIGVRADPSVRSYQRWITRTGRSSGFQFAWDTKRNQPNAYDRCVTMHQVGSNASSGGRIFGGNGKMLTVDCEERHAVVCTKQRVPVSINGINDALPVSDIPAVFGLPTTITFYGNRIPNGTLVSLQSMSRNMSGLSLQDKAPTHCKVVSNISGVNTPFALIPSDSMTSSKRLCNGTCMTAAITIPSTWPLVLGSVYSFCFYVPIPFGGTPSDLQEFQNELLGPRAVLRVVEHDVNFLSDVCARRSEDLQVVLGTGVTDSGRAARTEPYPMESPVEGRYDGLLREDKSEVILLR